MSLSRQSQTAWPFLTILTEVDPHSVPYIRGTQKEVVVKAIFFYGYLVSVHT